MGRVKTSAEEGDARDLMTGGRHGFMVMPYHER